MKDITIVLAFYNGFYANQLMWKSFKKFHPDFYSEKYLK